MTFDVLLLKQKDDGYSARPVLWPDAVVHGATQQEVMSRVQILIRDLLGRTQLVQVDVDVSSEQVNNPWLIKAGTFANDPTWGDFLQAIKENRRLVDAETARG